ncbi:aldo/keto reductase [Dysgonomonas macrotermitis]|uniref:Predicted oxidoreductase n=1 Tax=Dysgonomonas macrotermitis TaxID=1346286 RepID=A0A1M4ZG49_9BACT|nr:aldo/keto reductase [Dysgonomonas macrotermitis]SHF16928.1 Predicted oxidoreductase [Dysgonomonas macrotermitis]
MVKKRKIGKSDLEVIPFAFGGNVFGWTADEKASSDILDKYIGAGFDFIDTADIYSAWVPGNKGGESETIIGKWLKKTGKRNDVIISTKVGAEISETHRGLKKEYILREVEESLKRLQTDHIDLYFTHFDDLLTPVGETLEAYAQLVKEGKVRYIATSNMSPDRIRESLKYSADNNLPSYICLQPQYNLYDRQDYETKYEPLVKETGLGVVSYYSLASGFLTGKYHSVADIAASARQGQLKNYINDRGQSILTALSEVAKEYNATQGQIALVWLLARPSITAPIASVSKVEQLDILGAVNIDLSKEAIDKLNAASRY